MRARPLPHRRPSTAGHDGDLRPRRSPSLSSGCATATSVADVARVQGTRAVAAASLAALGLAAPDLDQQRHRHGRARRRDTRAGGGDRLHADPVPDHPARRCRGQDRSDPRGRRRVRAADPRSSAPQRGRPRARRSPSRVARASTRRRSCSSSGQGGKVVQKKVVTAAEGAPGRGPFSGTLVAPASGHYVVAAYSPSAMDGSPTARAGRPGDGHALSCCASTQSPATV